MSLCAHRVPAGLSNALYSSQLCTLCLHSNSLLTPLKPDQESRTGWHIHAQWPFMENWEAHCINVSHFLSCMPSFPLFSFSCFFFSCHLSQPPSIRHPPSCSLYVVLSGFFFSFWFALFPFCLTYLVIWPANRLNRFDCATMQSCTLLDQPSNNRFMWSAQWVETKKDRIWRVLVRQKNNMSATCRCCKCWAVTLRGSLWLWLWLVQHLYLSG